MSFESPSMKRRSLSDSSTGSASKRCASGGSSAVVSAGSRAAGISQIPDFGRSPSPNIPAPPLRGSGDRADAPRMGERRTRRQQLIGDELDEAQGNLDDQIFMGNWEHIGPPGAYADGVYKGLQRSNNAEVAVKVVSLLNPHIMNSEWVRAKLAEYHKKGTTPTEQQKLKVYEEKVLLEMYNTQTLSSKHICFFVGYFKESSSYSDKVIKNPSHKIRQYFDPEKEPDRPFGTHSVFFVMENLSGGDLFEYNASARYGCGFLLAFEAAPLVTEDVVHEALSQFPPFLPASDAPSESVELKKSVELRKTYKDYLYLNTPFVHLQKGKAGEAKFLVLKFNTSFKRDFIKYMSPETALNRGMEMLAAEMQKFLTSKKLICCSAPVNPLPLFFDQAFIRTTLTQIMIALSHAHGSSLYHNDLKPDNIMFKERVHAHASNESKICAKIIDWGCGGFSKDNESHHHPFKPLGEPTGKEVDMFCVGNTLLFLFNGKVGVDGWEKELYKSNFWTKGTILPEFFCQRTFKCRWNKSPDCQDIDAGLCVPWNPNDDVHFKQLVRSMLDPDPEKRPSVKDVLRDRWMKAPRRAEPAQTGEGNPHIKKLNDLLYDFAPPHLKHMHDSTLIDGPNEETRFLDLIKSSDLPNIRRALEVLVMLPLLVKVHYAQGFIASNLVAVLSKFVNDYMYNNEYPQRHLPRTMVLLSQLASHQNTEILSQIFKTKYHGHEHQGHDSDAGRPLLDLIAYGVFDCHDPDPNHKACSLYTMLMLIALSSPTDDPDQSSYKTQDVVRFLRDKNTKHPKPLKSIFEKLVFLLEQLTHPPDDAKKLRRAELTELLSMQSSHLKALHRILHEAEKNPTEAAIMLDEDQDSLKSIRLGLLDLQHAVIPTCKDPHFSRFIDKFLALPDPGSQLLKIHKLLKFNDYTAQDEMEPMLRSNNGIITSSTHGILARLVQAVYNLSMTSSGREMVVEGGEHSFLHRLMRCMQSVNRLYPKAFQADRAQVQFAESFVGSALYSNVKNLWKEHRAAAARVHFDREFLKMFENDQGNRARSS